jgi:hypothetical protein
VDAIDAENAEQRRQVIGMAGEVIVRPSSGQAFGW